MLQPASCVETGLSPGAAGGTCGRPEVGLWLGGCLVAQAAQLTLPSLPPVLCAATRVRRPRCTKAWPCGEHQLAGAGLLASWQQHGSSMAAAPDCEAALTLSNHSCKLCSGTQPAPALRLRAHTPPYRPHTLAGTSARSRLARRCAAMRRCLPPLACAATPPFWWSAAATATLCSSTMVS